MAPESLKDFLIEFVNHGIVPMVVKELWDSSESIDLEELDAAQLQVQKDVIRFFEGLDTAEELDAHDTLAAEDRDPILGRLALHFGLTREEVVYILALLSEKDEVQ